MIKKILLSTAVILLISGCSDKSDKKDDTKKVVEQKQENLKIEVEENKNAKEIKVTKHAPTNNKDKTYYFNYTEKGEYDPNSQPANKDASVRVKPRTNIEANMNVKSPYDNIKISLMVKKLSKDFIVKCSACHNDYANGIIGPSLLGKDESFIYKKIKEFQSNKDANVLMTGLVNQMSDKEIKKLASEISEFNKEIIKLGN